MKLQNVIFNAKALFLSFFSLLYTISSFAQDSTTTTTTATNSTATSTETLWYMQPWAWVVGGIVLLLIIIGLARGNRSEKVIVTRTVTRDGE